MSTMSEVINPKQVDWNESNRIATAVSAQPGRCVSNVARAFLYYLHLLPADALYIQGLWLLGGQCDSHVWIETDQTIIDPTLAARDLHSFFYLHYKHSQPILVMCPELVLSHYCGFCINPGEPLDLILDSSDPRVKIIEPRFDPRGGIPLCPPGAE